MSFTVQKLTPNIGAEIVGLDISQPLNPATVQAVRQAWLDNSMLVFRGQNLDAEAQRRFVGYFGIMGKRAAALPSKTERPAGPDYNSDAMLVSNIRHDGKPIGVLPDGEMWFHHDMSYAAAPNRASFLYSLEIPGHGGDTMFASMYAAYDALSDRMKGYLDKLTATHDGRKVFGPNAPVNIHPIVAKHPISGRKLLYINRGQTSHINEVPRDESDAVLGFLYQHCAHPDFQLRFRWKPDSIAFWDNRCTHHRAIWDYYPNVRSGFRVQIKGSAAPVAA